MRVVLAGWRNKRTLLGQLVALMRDISPTNLPDCLQVKVTRMRERIAQRLKDAQNTYAMLTTFQEADMFNLINMREDFKVRLSFLCFARPPPPSTNTPSTALHLC